MAWVGFTVSWCGVSRVGVGLVVFDAPGTALPGTAQNFALFFSTLPPQNSCFSSLSGGLFVEFWWCLKRRGAQMCTFGVLWLSCEAPAAENKNKKQVRVCSSLRFITHNISLSFLVLLSRCDVWYLDRERVTVWEHFLAVVLNKEQESKQVKGKKGMEERHWFCVLMGLVLG